MLKSLLFRKLSIFKRTPTSFKNIICVFVIMYCTYPLYRSLKLCVHRLIVFIVFTLLLYFKVNDSKYQYILPAQIFVDSPSWQLINSRSKCFTRQKLTTFRTSHISSKLDNWDERMYCTPIKKALKMKFYEEPGNFLRQTISTLSVASSAVRFWTSFCQKMRASTVSEFNDFESVTK